MDHSLQDFEKVRNFQVPYLQDPDAKLFVVNSSCLGVDHGLTASRFVRNLFSHRYNREAVLNTLLHISQEVLTITKRCSVQLSDVWSGSNSRIFKIQHLPRERYIQTYHLLSAKVPLWLLTVQQVSTQYCEEHTLLEQIQEVLAKVLSLISGVRL